MNGWKRKCEGKSEAGRDAAKNEWDHNRKGMGGRYMKQLPICDILGVHVCVTSMPEVVALLKEYIEELRGKYICVSNVHTTVMAYENSDYMAVQNGAAYVLPDGKPLSIVSRKRGFSGAQRVAGPDLMGELFRDAEENRTALRHYFFGGSPETIKALEAKLKETYPHLQTAGFVSPPFRKLTEKEDEEAVRLINESGADILWVGLGAPKQENWMQAHEGRVHAVMLGVGAGFDFHAGTIKRAPKWMQKCSLEWLYRLCQEPGRLMKRYLKTNLKFVRLVRAENRRLRASARKSD